MIYSNIVDRLKTDIAEASGIGSIYTRQRHATDDHVVSELFVHGSEILDDTGFASQSRWSGDWTVSGGQASETATGSDLDLIQVNANFDNKLATGTYLLSFTVVANTLVGANAGEVRGVCTATAFTFSDDGEETNISITVNSATSNLVLRLLSTNTSGALTIDNISLKREKVFHFWEIYRDGDSEQSDYNTLIVTRDNYKIEGWHSLDDSTSTENSFQTIVDSVVDKLHDDRALGGYGHIVAPIRKSVSNDIKSGILCHHALLEAQIIVPQEVGISEDQVINETSILTSATRTTSSQSSGYVIDKYADGNFVIAVTATSGILNLLPQISYDDVTYYDADMSPKEISATGNYSIPFVNTAKYVRIKYTISTSGSFTFQVDYMWTEKQ